MKLDTTDRNPFAAVNRSNMASEIAPAIAAPMTTDRDRPRANAMTTNGTPKVGFDNASTMPSTTAIGVDAVNVSTPAIASGTPD